MQIHVSKKKSFLILEVAAILLLVSILALTLVFLFRKPSETKDIPVTAETQPVTETLPPTEEMLVVSDGAGGEISIPVLGDVPVSTKDTNKLVLEDGRYYYMENGTVTSSLGVDVSEFQGEIDWAAVKESGIDFAIIRAGFRGYESGKLLADEMFHTNMQAALDAGLAVGVYFYSQAITPEEAVQEADFVLAMSEGYDITYPIVFDWEYITDDSARTDHMNAEELTQCTSAFCQKIQSAGYHAMIYQNTRTSYFKIDLSQLTEFEFWLADYSETGAEFYYDYDMWQYCSDGVVPGIDGEVDMNISFRDYTALDPSSVSEAETDTE